jgi:hypothetical protein
LVKRTVWRLVDRRPICNGNRETLKTMFSRESILLWHFKSFKRKRMRIRSWAADPDGPTIVSFSWPSQVERWLAELALGTT